VNDIRTIRCPQVDANVLPGPQLVPEIVSAHAFLSPDALAITDETESLTYRELNDRANALSDVLRTCGVGPDVVVGLLLPRSSAMIVGALGILKAGGAYLPLDPAHPAERLAFIFDDADVSLVVAASDTGPRFPIARSTIILKKGGFIFHSPEPSCSARKQVAISQQNLAYVIYTSGSTGKPKGVEITHAGLSNLVRWHLDAFAVTLADRASHIAGVGFDASVWEIWPHLAAGAILHLPSEETVRDPFALRDWIVRQNITISFVPTPLAEYLLRLPWPSGTALRTMLTGADTLHLYPPLGLPFTLFNNYGPTECTVVATSGPIHSEDSNGPLPPIGSPISNTHVYILDEAGNPAPPGRAGELHIAGPGVARSYRGNPKLTAEKFIPNSFNGSSSPRLFKTGDLGKLLPDGRIAFLGRMDEQVKVRGFRVEPSEVAAVLNQHPLIAHGVVAMRELAPGDKRLVAYIVLRPQAQLSLPDIRDFLRPRLPDYMVPATFVTLDKLPLNANGKVDRRSLPLPDNDNTLRDGASAAPASEMEKIVAGMLTSLLKVERVEVGDNFFSLGGHSLLGAQLVARVRDAFGIELPLRVLFEAPTVAEVAAEIEALLVRKLDAMSEEEARRLLASIHDSVTAA
jgi:amino acid adenylation domain-containing protein